MSNITTSTYPTHSTIKELYIALSEDKAIQFAHGDKSLFGELKTQLRKGEILTQLFEQPLAKVFSDLIDTAQTESNATTVHEESTGRNLHINCKYDMEEKTYLICCRPDDSDSQNSDHFSYKTLFHNSPLPNIIYDIRNFEILEVNDQALKHFGYSKKEMEHMSLMQIRPKDEGDVVQKKHAAVNNRTEVINFGVCTFQNSKGKTLKMDVTGMRIQYKDKPCMITEYQDVTEAEHNLHLLKNSEARFRALQESMTSYLVRTNLQGEYTYANSKFLHDFQQTEDIIGTPSIVHVLPDHHQRLIETVQACLTQPGKVIQVELDKPKGDDIVHTIWEFMCVTDQKGIPSEIQCVGLDITQKVQFEKQLKASNQRYNLLNEVTKDAIYEWDIIHDKLHWGSGLERLFGHTGDFEMTQWSACLHPKEKETVLKNLDACLADKNESLWNQEYQFQKANGSYAYVEEIGHIERDDTGKPIKMIGVIRDVTQAHDMERMIKTASSMSRLGAFEFYPEEDLNVWSPVVYEIFEFNTNKKINYQDILDSIAPEFRQDSSNNIQNLRDTRSHIQQEYRIFTKTGKEKWVLVNAQSEYVLGNRFRIYGSVQDITERKNTEIRLKNLSDNLPGVTYQYSLSPEGKDKLSLVSSKSMDLWGYTPEQVEENINLVWEGIAKGGQLEYAAEAVKRSAETLAPIRIVFPYIKPDGTKIWNGLYGEPHQLGDGTRIWNSVILDVSKEQEAQILADKVKDIAKIGIWELHFIDQQVQLPNIDSGFKKIIDGNTDATYTLDQLFELVAQSHLSTIKKYFFHFGNLDEQLDTEIKIKTFQGEEKWVRVIGEREQLTESVFRIYGSIQDITIKKRNEESIKQKTSYLSSLAKIASEFLELEDWDKKLDTCLKIAGETVGADRVYYFENHVSSDGELLSSQRYEYTKGNVNPEINNPELQNIPMEAFGDIYTTLKNGEPFNALVNDLPEGPTKEILASQEILSVLIIPLFTGDQFTGYLGFDDCSRNHSWTESESNFLSSIGDSLEAAIQRYNYNNQLKQTITEKEDILDRIEDGFGALTADYTVTYWNPKAEKITKISRENILHHNIWEVMGSDVRDHYLKKALEQKNETHTKYEVFYKDIQKHIEVNVYPSPTGFSIFFRDITESKIGEIELQKSEEKYRVLLESSDAAIIMLDADGTMVYANEIADKPFTSDPSSPSHGQSIQGMNYRQIFTEEEGKLLSGVIKNIMTTNEGWINELPLEMAGIQHWYRLSLQPIRNDKGKPYAILVVANDVSEARIAQNQLLASEEKYRALIESSDSGIAMFGGDGTILYMNDFAQDLLIEFPEFKKGETEIIGQNVRDILSVNTSENQLRVIHKVIQDNTGFVMDVERPWKNGTKWFRVSVQPIRSEDGNATAVMTIFNDITEIKRSASIVAENEKRYRFLFEESPVAMMIQGADGQFIDINNAALKVYGYEREDLVGHTPAIFSAEYQPNGQLSSEFISQVVEETMTKGSNEFKWLHKRKDGSHFLGFVSLFRSVYEGQTVIFSLVQDLTESLAAEIELKKFREIADKANYGTAIYSDNKYQYVNRLYADMYQYEPEEFLGQSTDMVNQRLDRDHLMALREMINTTGEIRNVESQAIRKDGSAIPILLNVKQITSDLNEQFFLISMIDISERKQMEEENKQLRIAIEKSPVAMIVTDLHGNIEYSSPSFTRITGYSQQEVLGKSTKILKSGLEEPEKYQQMWENISSGNIWQGELINKRKDGSLFHERLSITPITNSEGDITNYLGIKQDITESVDYQNSLMILNKELEVKATELEKSNKELEQFAYVASHDLQEPLRMVTGFMSQLKKKYSDSLDEKANQYIYFAVDGAERMRRIILDLLDYSRVGRIQGELEKVNLNAVIEEVIQLQNKLIEDKNAEIKCDHLPTVFSYRTAWTQVFQNLISNALKYAKTDVPAIVEISCKERKSDWVFTVKDNGVGIKEEYYEKIFVIFQRLHNQPDAVGTGMGLAIVKKQVENLNGTIKVESNYGEGTIFTVTISKKGKVIGSKIE